MVITVTDKTGNSDNIDLWNDDDALDLINEYMGRDFARYVEDEVFGYHSSIAFDIASTAEYEFDSVRESLEDILETELPEEIKAKVSNLMSDIKEVANDCRKHCDYFDKLGLALTNSWEATESVL